MAEIVPISQDLLDILRDPAAVQEKEKYGDDPGQLELVHNCWLVSKDTGYKYPIKEGIPVMLIEEGKKWKDTAIEDLPVPPPPLLPESSPAPAAGSAAPAASNETSPIVYALAGIGGLVVLLVLWRILAGGRK